MFPCNRWLSTSDEDKQICRELSCANLSAGGATGNDKEKMGLYLVSSGGVVCSSGGVISSSGGVIRSSGL